MLKSGKRASRRDERTSANEGNSAARTRFNRRDFNGRRKRSGAARTVEKTRRPAPPQNPLTLFYYKRKILQSGRRTISALSRPFQRGETAARIFGRFSLFFTSF
jgi:hypothetical protein